MEIRRAEKRDLNGINTLLSEVLEIHHNGRRDLFKSGTKKYTDEELIAIIEDEKRPIFVAVENETVLGYVFCIFTETKDNNILIDRKTLYIDDLCVLKEKRGCRIGKTLYEYAKSFASENGFYNLTLNVWSFNEDALLFYQKMGMTPQKTVMEQIL